MKYDFSSTGLYTFDCLGWPFTVRAPDELRGAVRALADHLTRCAAEP